VSQLQKNIGGDEPAKSKSKIADDEKAKSAVKRAKEALKMADKAQERGHFLVCCGIKTWIPHD